MLCLVINQSIFFQAAVLVCHFVILQKKKKKSLAGLICFGLCGLYALLDGLINACRMPSNLKFRSPLAQEQYRFKVSATA